MFSPPWFINNFLVKIELRTWRISIVKDTTNDYFVKENVHDRKKTKNRLIFYRVCGMEE